MTTTADSLEPSPASPDKPGEKSWVPEFLRNRALFQVDALQPYDGQWVAFSKDGTRIIAADLDLMELERKLAEIGLDPQQVVLEQVWATDDIYLGGAEFL